MPKRYVKLTSYLRHYFVSGDTTVLVEGARWGWG